MRTFKNTLERCETECVCVCVCAPVRFLTIQIEAVTRLCHFSCFYFHHHFLNQVKAHIMHVPENEHDETERTKRRLTKFNLQQTLERCFSPIFFYATVLPLNSFLHTFFPSTSCSFSFFARFPLSLSRYTIRIRLNTS